MEWLSSLLGLTKTQNQSDGGIGEYDTIPATGLDLPAKAFTLTRCIVVEGQLDVDRLKETSFELVETKFRKLGSRLAFVDGEYVFRVPRRFSDEVPPIAFTTQHFDSPYSGPALPTHPKNVHEPPFAQPIPLLQPYSRSPTCPKELTDWLNPNMPCVHIHVTTFEDYTFLGITASHIFFDGGGGRAFLGAWLSYLRGDKDSVPVSPWDYSPFSEWAEQAVKRAEATPDYPLGKTPSGYYWLSRWGAFQFIWYLLMRILHDRTEIGLLLSIPRKWLETEKQKIMQEIRAEAEAKGTKCEEYVASNDVMFAWLYKASIQTSYSISRRNLKTVVYRLCTTTARMQPLSTSTLSSTPCPLPLDFRASLLPKRRLRGTQPDPPIPASDFSKQSLGQLARLFRRHVIASVNDRKGIIEGCGDIVAFGQKTPQQFPCPPGALYETISNWRTFGFGKLDFSAALKGGCEGGKVVFVCAYAQDTIKIPGRGVGVCTGEDVDTIWLTLPRGKKDWDTVRSLGKLDFLGCSQ